MDGKATMTEARAAVDTVEVIRDPVTGSWSLGATEPVEGVEVLVAALAEDAPRTRRLRPRSPMDRFERWLAKVGTALVLWLRALPGRLPVAAARLDLLRTRLRRSVGHALQAARRVRFRLPRWAPVAAAGLLVAAGIATVVTVVVISPAPSAPADPAPVAPAAAGPAASIDRAFIDLDAVIAEGDALAAAVTADQLADPRAFSGLLGALVDAKAALGGTPQQAGRVMTELRGAIDRVHRSHSAKTLADAQSALAAVLGTAEQVIAESEGRVDDAMRTELQARVDAARPFLTGAHGVDEVNAWTTRLTDQIALVLEARGFGFREAEGRWCDPSGKSCVTVEWPGATLADGKTVELAGGENALGGSGCYQTDEFGKGREKAALLYCPAGEQPPSGTSVASLDKGDAAADRLWLVQDGKASALRYRS